MVVLQTGGPVEMPWASRVVAVLRIWRPGQEARHAVADMLLGGAEPVGRLPQSFPMRWEDGAIFTQDREVRPGLDGYARCDEGGIGRRRQDRAGTPPLSPSAQAGLRDVRGVRPRVGAGFGGWRDGPRQRDHTGDREGFEAVQIYVASASAPVPRPGRHLKAFARARLAPGENRRVELRLPLRALA